MWYLEMFIALFAIIGSFIACCSIVWYLVNRRLNVIKSEIDSEVKESKAYVRQTLDEASETFDTKLSEARRDLVDGFDSMAAAIVEDDELIQSFLQGCVRAISNHFASQKATNVRQQKTLDRKLVRGILAQKPGLLAIGDALGITEYVEDKPQLLFYLMSQYPQLFQMGEPTLPVMNQNVEAPPELYTPGVANEQRTSKEVREDGLQEGMGGLQKDQSFKIEDFQAIN